MGVVVPLAFAAVAKRKSTTRSRDLLELLECRDKAEDRLRRESNDDLKRLLVRRVSELNSDIGRHAKLDSIPWIIVMLLPIFCLTEFALILWLTSQLRLEERLPFFEGILAGLQGKVWLFLVPLAISSGISLFIVDDPTEPVLGQIIKVFCLLNLIAVIVLAPLLLFLYFADNYTRLF